MNTFLRIYWVLVGLAFLNVFFQKIYFKCREKQEIGYCRNIKFLLSADRGVARKTIDHHLTGDSLHSFLEQNIIYDSCSRNYFSLPFDFETNRVTEPGKGVQLAAFIEKDCPNPYLISCIFIAQDVRFYADEDRIRFGLEDSVTTDSIAGYIRFRQKSLFELTGEEISYISIVFDNQVEKSVLETIIPQFVAVYVEFLSKKVSELYNTGLCDLNLKQMIYLKQKYPLQIEIVPRRLPLMAGQNMGI